MDDIGYYLAEYPAPLFCVSPDSDFPAVNGEKGIYHARLISRHQSDRVLDISGGVAPNAVAAAATARVRADALRDGGGVHADSRSECRAPLDLRNINFRCRPVELDILP